jgi:hypothetical protein
MAFLTSVHFPTTVIVIFVVKCIQNSRFSFDLELILLYDTHNLSIFALKLLLLHDMNIVAYWRSSSSDFSL